jgi:hypothetical protein
MKTVAEYRQFAQSSRELAAKLSNPKDKYAMLLMAGAWDKVADQREAALSYSHGRRTWRRRPFEKH